MTHFYKLFFKFDSLLKENVQSSFPRKWQDRWQNIAYALIIQKGALTKTGIVFIISRDMGFAGWASI